MNYITQRLRKILSKHHVFQHQKHLLETFGSVANGLYCQSKSDLDLTLIVEEGSKTQQQVLNDVIDALKTTKQITVCIEFADRPNLVRHIRVGEIIPKIGVVLKEEKFGYPAGHKVEVDILLNQHLSVKNSAIIRQYCNLDSRFRDAALVLKRWTQTTSQQYYERLCPFSVYMLLLAFMIHRKYMPNLQQQKNLV